MKPLGAALSLLFALTLEAQFVRVRIAPPAPTVHDQIVAQISTPCLGYDLDSVMINGNRIDVTVGFDGEACLPLVGRVDAPIGQLPSGSYTLFVTFRENTDVRGPFEAISFQVQDAAIPALDTRAAILLAAALASIGVLLLRNFR